jgi:formylglycine-generating enzyme required for sulfatase activity
VINISWDDATAFAKWMGCRLPTEAEWEYACRAGSTTPFNTGENLTTSQANYGSDQTRTVGTLTSNAFGLYDMHGNVWEWCSDWHGDYPSSPQTNPKGPSDGPLTTLRVIRGGSWNDKAPHFCRSASRNKNRPGSVYLNIGFRLVSLE